MYILKRIFSFSTNKSMSRNKSAEKIKLQNLQKYYTDKINYLTDFRGSKQLAILACRDAPTKLTNRNSNFCQRSFVKSCLKHYKNKFNEIDRELKKFN